MNEIFYLAKNNINGGIDVYREPPIKILRVRDASVHWNGESVMRFYHLERFIPALKQPPGTCMKVEVGSVDGMIVIKVLDENVECKVSYH